MCTQFTKNCILADRLDREAGFSSTAGIRNRRSVDTFSNSHILAIWYLDKQVLQTRLLRIPAKRCGSLKLHPNMTQISLEYNKIMIRQYN